MRRKSFMIQSVYDGLELEVLCIQPSPTVTVKGVIQFSHGMCEYKERYEPFMEYLCKKGFACVIHDHRGHGNSVKSQEDLGYFYGGGDEAVISDLYQITRMIKRHWKGVPLILFAHSMGTLTARSYIKRYDNQIDLLILSGSPSKNPALPLGRALAYMERAVRGDKHRSALLQALTFGPYIRKFREEKSRFAWCCSDPETVAAYDASPLCGFNFTIDGYLSLFEMMQRAYGSRGWQCKNPDLPILFISGSDDPCLTNTRRFKQALDALRYQGYWNVRGKLYPGLRHEILNEIGKEGIYEDIYKYILKNLA